MSRAVFTTIVILLMSLSAIAQNSEGEIHGVILDAVSNAPVSKIAIFVQGEEVARTDEDGAFNVRLAAGDLELELRGEGYPDTRLDTIPIITDEVTEVIVALSDKEGETKIDIEAAREESASVQEEAEDLPLSTIEGVVMDVEKRAPVPGVRIFVRGFALEAKTDDEGRFRIEIPIGIHDISAVHPDYSTMTKAGVKVVEGETTKVELEAVPVSIELEEFTVSAPKVEGSTVDVLKERQESTAVTEVIGAEQMSRSGDSDAAGALKRVTGVTIVGGKYVYVRGLGDRYSSTLLNGLALPSPEPERRVVPLDMFPTGILESVVIQKAYSPDMPGEFGGGVVQLRTKGYPSEFMFDLELSAGMTAGDTFTTGQKPADWGPTDWLGIDGGYRDLPKSFEKAISSGTYVECDRFTTENCLTAEEMSKFANVMPNNWGVKDGTIPPDLKLVATIGDSYKKDIAKFGFMTSLIYDNAWDLKEEKINEYTTDDTGELSRQSYYTFNYNTNTVTLGGILTLGVELTEDHRIWANTIIDRITDNTLRPYEGYNRDQDRIVKYLSYQWVERMLLSQQVLGTHVLKPLGDLKVDWSYAYSRATRDEPDKRWMRYDYMEESDVYILSGHPSGNGRDYRDVKDEVHNARLDFTYPFEQWTNETAKIKAGGAVLFKMRASDVQRFSYDKLGNVGEEANVLEPYDFFNLDIGELGVRYIDNTQTYDKKSDAEQELFAGYVMTDLPLGLGFGVNGGLRIESSDQKVTSVPPYQEDPEPEVNELDKLDFLPAAGINYSFLENMLVRVSYGRSLNRPDFREMTPVCYYAYDGGARICGPKETITDPDTGEEVPYDLDRAVIDNFDARWEWYPSETESISFGGFYKRFIEPIELVVFKSGGGDDYNFMNAKAANNYGLELDFLKNFGFISDPLEDLYVAGNVTWVRSEIEVPKELSGIQTSNKRPLQGQSPYIINFQIGYNNVDIGTTVTLLYNVFGERIAGVGTLERPDIYEQPYHQLDFVAKQSLGKGFKLGFKAKNLIDLPVKFLQGDKVTSEYRKGRYFSLSLQYSY